MRRTFFSFKGTPCGAALPFAVVLGLCFLGDVGCSGAGNTRVSGWRFSATAGIFAVHSGGETVFLEESGPPAVTAPVAGEGVKPTPAPSEPRSPSPAAATPKPEKPAIQKVAENIYRIGEVTVDTKQGTVSFPARVNLRKGVLEVLICTEYGKAHESLLTTKAEPLHLNVALLLLGLEGGNAVRYQGDPTKPVGSPVEIWFSVKEGEGERRVRAEDWVYNTHRKRPMLHTNWVYVGSVVTKDGFMAQREGQIATTFHDPFALLDNPLPGGADDTVYVPNTQEVPPCGTHVTVAIKAVRRSLRKP